MHLRMCDSGRTLIRRRRRGTGCACFLLLVISTTACASRDAAADANGAVYEYVYPYNTETLVENHFIVLDTIDGVARGWYYGTSDEFDRGREGYLPGFFVAELDELRITGDSIAFALHAPAMFTTPVPLRYRDVAAVPVDSLTRWEGPALEGTNRYAGSIAPNEIVLTTKDGARRFTRRQQ